MRRNVIVESFLFVDMSALKMPVITIYQSPKDFSGKFVARIFDGFTNWPTNVCIVKEDLESVREDIMAAGFMVRFPRDKYDDRCIVETWMR